MSNTSTAAPVTLPTPFSAYAAVLIPAAIIIFGGLQPVLDDPTNWSVSVPFGLLVLGTVVTYFLKLLPSGWQGAAKTIAQVVTVIVTALVPFILPGGFDPDVNFTFIVLAVLNALGTAFGVEIRKAADPQLR